MFIACVIALATILQFTAAYKAFRLIHLTGRRLAWGLISVAMILMSARRFISFSYVFDEPSFLDLTDELVGLAISALMVIGVWGIAPLFLAVKKSEEEIRESEEKYRSIFENAVMGIFRTAPDGHYLSINPAGARIYGYDSDEEMMRSVTNMAHQIYVYPEDRKRFKELVEGKGFVEGFESEHYARDGSTIWVSMNARVVRDPSGSIMYYETTSEDITKRKKAEKELESYNLRLEGLVRERTRELEKAKETAEGADRLKSTFLATMSHELRTPLNSIIGFTGILLQGYAGPLNEEQAKQLGMVQKSSKHLLHLINDVLDISKIEAGQVVFEPVPFNLRASIESVVDYVRPLAEKKGLSLSAHIDEAIGEFIGDQRRIEQSLINLVNNGIKFTEKGGVIILCRKDASRTVIDIKDTGIGIGPDDMEKIFMPFKQTDIGIAKKQEGTGLGLSITKKLIEMMGGQVLVRSEVGVGSTFTIVLNTGPE